MLENICSGTSGNHQHPGKDINQQKGNHYHPSCCPGMSGQSQGETTLSQGEEMTQWQIVRVSPLDLLHLVLKELRKGQKHCQVGSSVRVGQTSCLWGQTSKLPVMGTTASADAGDQPSWLKQGLTTQNQRCGRPRLYSPLNPLYSCFSQVAWVFLFKKTLHTQYFLIFYCFILFFCVRRFFYCNCKNNFHLKTPFARKCWHTPVLTETTLHTKQHTEAWIYF